MAFIDQSLPLTFDVSSSALRFEVAGLELAVISHNRGTLAHTLRIAKLSALRSRKFPVKLKDFECVYLCCYTKFGVHFVPQKQESSTPKELVPAATLDLMLISHTRGTLNHTLRMAKVCALRSKQVPFKLHASNETYVLKEHDRVVYSVPKRSKVLASEACLQRAYPAPLLNSPKIIQNRTKQNSCILNGVISDTFASGRQVLKPHNPSEGKASLPITFRCGSAYYYGKLESVKKFKKDHPESQESRPKQFVRPKIPDICKASGRKSVSFKPRTAAWWFDQSVLASPEIVKTKGKTSAVHTEMTFPSIRYNKKMIVKGYDVLTKALYSVSHFKPGLSGFFDFFSDVSGNYKVQVIPAFEHKIFIYVKKGDYVSRLVKINKKYSSYLLALNAGSRYLGERELFVKPGLEYLVPLYDKNLMSMCPFNIKSIISQLGVNPSKENLNRYYTSFKPFSTNYKLNSHKVMKVSQGGLGFLSYVSRYVENYLYGIHDYYSVFESPLGDVIKVLVEGETVNLVSNEFGKRVVEPCQYRDHVLFFEKNRPIPDRFANHRMEEDGYCYLNGLYDASVQLGKACPYAEALRRLGKYPKFSKVKEIYSKTMGYKPACLFGYYVCGRFHNDPFVNDVVFLHNEALVGGIEESSSSLLFDQELLPALSTAVQKSGLGRDSLLVRTMETEAIQLKEDIKALRRCKQEVVVTVDLGEDKQSLLISSYPEFNIKFTHSAYSPHAMAAASRVLENAIHHMRSGAKYGDIGGDPLYHSKHGHSGVHICRPVYDMKDAHRRVMRHHTYNKLGIMKGESLDKFIEGSAISVCGKVASACKHVNEVLSLTQVYDIPLQQLCEIMITKQANVAYLSIISPGELLIPDRNSVYIPTLDCAIVKDVDADTVVYKYSNTTYTHNLSSILSYMKNPHLVIKSYLFSVEMVEVRCNVNYYVITKSSVCPAVSISRVLRYPNADKHVTRVKLPVFDDKGKRCTNRFQYIYLDSDYFSKVYEHTVNSCQSINSKTFEYVWNFIKCSKARIVISGKIVRRDVSMDVELLKPFCSVMLVVGVKNRLLGECFSKKLAAATGDMSVWGMVTFALSEQWDSLMASVLDSTKNIIRKFFRTTMSYEFLDSDDLFTTIDDYSEHQFDFSHEGFGTIPENEEEHLINESLRRSLNKTSEISIAADIVKSELSPPKTADSRSEGKKNSGGLKGGFPGASYLQGILEMLSKIPVHCLDLAKSIIKSLRVLVSKLGNKVVNALANIFFRVDFFDSHSSRISEVLVNISSKFLTALSQYISGVSGRDCVKNALQSLILDYSINLFVQPPQDILTSQFIMCMKDSFSKFICQGMKLYSVDGVITVTGIQCTLTRKLLAAVCSDPLYSNYQILNNTDSVLYSYVKRECKRLGLSIDSYLKDLVLDCELKLRSMLSECNIKTKTTAVVSGAVSGVVKAVKETFGFGNGDSDDEDFYDASDRPGLLGGSPLVPRNSGFIGQMLKYLYNKFRKILKNFYKYVMGFQTFDVTDAGKTVFLKSVLSILLFTMRVADYIEIYYASADLKQYLHHIMSHLILTIRRKFNDLYYASINCASGYYNRVVLLFSPRDPPGPPPQAFGDGLAQVFDLILQHNLNNDLVSRQNVSQYDVSDSEICAGSLESDNNSFTFSDEEYYYGEGLGGGSKTSIMLKLMKLVSTSVVRSGIIKIVLGFGFDYLLCKVGTLLRSHIRFVCDDLLFEVLSFLLSPNYVLLVKYMNRLPNKSTTSELRFMFGGKYRLPIVILDVLDKVFDSTVYRSVYIALDFIRSNLKFLFLKQQKPKVSYTPVPTLGKLESLHSQSIPELVSEICDRHKMISSELKDRKSRGLGDGSSGTESGNQSEQDDDDSDSLDGTSSQDERKNEIEPEKISKGDESESSADEGKPDLTSLSHDFESLQTNSRSLRGLNKNKSKGDCEYLKLLNISVSPPKPYIRALGSFSNLTNSIREFYYLQEISLYELYSKISLVYSELKSLKFRRELLVTDCEDSLVLYDRRNGLAIYQGGKKVVKKESALDYSHCFCEYGLVSVSRSKGCDMVLYHEDTKFLPQNLFLKGMSTAIPKFTNCDVQIKLYEAPPGGGKTHTLLDIYNRTAEKLKVIIVTANKNSQTEIERKTKRVKSKLQKKSVLTIDSYLMNHLGKTCDLLLVDECFMVHSGATLACIEYTKCKSVILFGDSRQIHYIHRSELEVSTLFDLNNFIDASARVYGKVSYRCPWDVCQVLSTYYPNKIVSRNSTSEGQCSMRCHPINSEEDIEMSNEYKYITYTQEEKHKLQHYLNKRGLETVVQTVHEIQGETYTKVNLVRLKFQEDSPFISDNHIIVAISRHTDSLVYSVLSSRRLDATSSLISKASGIAEQFRRYNTAPTYSDYSLKIEGAIPESPGFSKACSAPIECLNSWLESVIPNSTTVDLGDTSSDMSSNHFESGVDNVIVRDTPSTDRVSTALRV